MNRKTLVLAFALPFAAYAQRNGLSMGVTVDERITLPDGTVRDRFIEDNGKRREIVLVETPKVPGNDLGYRMTYRDAMKEGDKEFKIDSKAAGKAADAKVAAAAEAKARADAEAKARAEAENAGSNREWTEDDSKSDIIAELVKRKIEHNPKDNKNVLLKLLNAK